MPILTGVVGNMLVRTVGRGSNSKRFTSRVCLNAVAAQEMGRRSGFVASRVKTRHAEIKLGQKVAPSVWSIPRVISPSQEIALEALIGAGW